MANLQIAAALIWAFPLAACALGPDFAAPEPGLPQDAFVNPASATSSKETGLSSAASQPVDPTWWKAFHDPLLTDLEQRVAAANLDIKAATLRIAESRFQRGVAAAAELPSLNGTGQYQRELYSQNGIVSLLSPLVGGHAISIAPINDYTTGFDASWELDIWGKVRRQVEAADAQVDLSQEQRRGALVSALAEVARDYIQLRGAQSQLKIATDNLQIEQEILQLTRTRQAKGLTTGLDVENAAAQVEAVRAQIPSLEQQESEQINALSFLLDLPPNGLRAELTRAKAIPLTPAQVPIGVPSELARRRPDIRQAEAQLHAATADIGVAVASFYPSVQLNGVVGLDALDFTNLWKGSSLQYNLGPSLTLPIFEGGKLKSMLQLSEAQQQEAFIAYHKTVLQAWHDVVNALVAYRTEQQRRARLGGQVEHSQQALTLARARYNDGVADFTTVLDTERTVLQAQQQYTQSTVNISVELVQLYKALGGGWELTYPGEMLAPAIDAVHAAQ
jgi:NodT family efflux transporter outer membrane factor (OMF) lipoprotein